MMDMDDTDPINLALSASTQPPNSSNREMLLEFDARNSQTMPDSSNARLSESAAAASSTLCHDIPTVTPRFQAITDTALPPASSAVVSGLPDGNDLADALTESDLSSFPSGSNSARLSSSGRCIHPFSAPYRVESQTFFSFVLSGIRQ
jgi:hypothetical protein